MTAYKIILFKNSKEPFSKMLKEKGIEFNSIMPPMGKMMACGDSIELVYSLLSNIPWESIAACICAWIVSKERRVVFITMKNGKTISLTAKGYPSCEVEKLLKSSLYITVIDSSNGKKP